MAEMDTKSSDEIKDVFIVHCSEDNEVAQKIRESLEANGKSVLQDFEPGKTIIDNIIYAVQHSKIVTIILTDTLRRSDWVKLEVNLAIEKAMAENKMCLRLVCVNITEELKKLFTDGTTLSKLPALYLDLTKENWQKELIDHIDAEMPMRELLPGGNAAIGTLFNYFAGYLQHVLPDLAGQVKKSDCYTKAPLRTFTKLILIIFESCNVKPIEGQYGDFTIVKTTESVTITQMHGGKPREYKLFFYSLTKAECEPYFFLADCPFILSTLSKMKADGFVDIDLQLQVASFRKQLVHILDYKGIAVKGVPNKFSNTAIVLELHDEQNVGSNLWRKLEDGMKPELSGDAQNPNMKTGQLKGNGFVLVVSSDNDKNLAKDVQSVLEKNEVIFKGNEVQDHFQQMASADWIIFILSQEGLNDKHLIQWYDAAMSSSINKDEIKVIPIVSKDTDVATLPDKIRLTVCLKEDDDRKYLEDIIKKIHGNKQKMTEKIPVFNVHEGLAYAYLFNYLPFTLCGKTVNGRDFRERLLDAKLKYDVDYPCVPRMFVIITRSCKFPTDIGNEKLLGPLEPVDVSGRKYFLQLYSLSLSTGQKVCYIREYATPAIAMHDMATKYEFAGLTKEEMYKQSEQFASFCQTIAENQGFMEKYGDITDRCGFLYVDDQSTTIAEKLEEVLLQHLNSNEVI